MPIENSDSLNISYIRDNMLYKPKAHKIYEYFKGDNEALTYEEKEELLQVIELNLKSITSYIKNSLL